MRCVSCGSQSLDNFQTEVAIHAHDRKAPLAFVFPRILVCLNCGRPEFDEEFVVPDDELRQLLKRAVARGS